jgi:hypothetical protein
LDMLAPLVDRRKAMLCRERDDPFPISVENRASDDEEGVSPLGYNGGKRRFVVTVANVDDDDGSAKTGDRAPCPLSR